MAEPKVIMVLVVAGLALLAALFFFIVLMLLFGPWLQGLMSGVRVTILELIGMRLRRINVRAVMQSLILARQSGVELSHAELQRAYLKGVDLEKITLAHIEARKRNLGTTFEDLVELELQDRLAQMLKE